MFDEVAGLVDAVGFEPDAEECQRLNRTIGPRSPYRSLTFLPMGLGSVDGERTLYLCRSRGVSSLYLPNRRFLDRFPDPDRFDVEGSQRVPLRALDALVDEGAVPLPAGVDFIKIDTQGSELDVLRGAQRTLDRQVLAVEVEVEFSRLYERQPLFAEVDAFLDGCGFSLFKLRRLEWVRKTLERQPQGSAGQVVFGDALYLRDPLNPEASWRPRDPRQAEALILIAILYDLHDFALELASAADMAGEIRRDAIVRYIHRRSRELNVPWNRTRTAVDLLRSVKAALTWMNRFRRYERSWARADTNFYSKV